MKYNLQISTDDANELARLVGFLNGSAALVKPDFVPAAAPLQPSSLQPAAQQPAFVPPQPGALTVSVGTDVDSTGLPWDARIHANTKAKNADGSWRGRRGVDDATVAAVEKELRAAAPAAMPQPAASPEALFGPAPAPAFVPQPMPAPVERQIDETFTPPAFLQNDHPAAPAPAPAFVPQPMPAPAPVMAPQPQPMPAPAPAPVMAPAPQPAPQQQPDPNAPLPALTFQQLMAAIAAGMRDKKIDNAYLGQLVAHYQLPGIPALATSHAALMPNIVQELRNRGVV